MNTEFKELRARLHDGRNLVVDDWSVSADQTWGIIGTNGSGKTVLSRLFAGDVRLSHGEVSGLPEHVAFVSLEAQAALIEQERREDESDLMDQQDIGTLVSELLAPVDEVSDWIQLLGMEHILSQGFRLLSTGESRKVMLVNAVRQTPGLLILDEPLEGLDAKSREALADALFRLHQSGQRLLWVANRLDELPDWLTHLAFVHDARLLVQGERESVLTSPEV
ncbi:MAG: ATP-binding cassette domain-containing protein, partial [Thalassolituus sp.]|nr:ATP-binding cassette domain-containing protein [Thalassolituus sp.]